MKKTNSTKKEVYIVTTGYNAGDAGDTVRYISLEYKSAFNFAKKLVKKLNKKVSKIKKTDSTYYGLFKKHNDKTRKWDLDEEEVSSWHNKIKNVTIRKYLIDKAYISDWSL